jgi:hypothetical protein
MDDGRFDDFLRTLAAPPSRRGVARALSGLILTGGAASLLGFTATEAKKKKCKGSTKKCGKKCIAATSCCTAADCGSGGACAGGVCVCAIGFRNCRDGCIPYADCCTDGDCVARESCQSGTCVCQDECCSNDDCAAGQICLQSQCVTGQGTCTAGDNSCLTVEKITCNSSADCFCYPDRNGGTHCAQALAPNPPCQSDSDCALLGLGAFCTPAVQFCDRGSGSGFCTLPCPT